MRIGFLGAGKAGFTLGKYFSDRGVDVVGYWSRNPKSAEDAAIFTNSTYYISAEELIRHCDTLFLTVPDGAIGTLWDGIKNFPLKDKLVCHVSGALSSGVFSDINQTGAFGYSIHPLFAIHSKYNSHKQIEKAFFTIEGAKERMYIIRLLMDRLGNNYAVIDSDKKELYHAAAVTASNHVLALLSSAQNYLVECGMTKAQAETALSPLFIGNAENAVECGVVNALTGPVERGDLTTIKKHISCLEGLNDEDKQLYLLLALKLCDLAEKKNEGYGKNHFGENMRTYLREELKIEAISINV